MVDQSRFHVSTRRVVVAWLWFEQRKVCGAALGFSSYGRLQAWRILPVEYCRCNRAAFNVVAGV